MLSGLFQHLLAPTAVVLYSGPQLSQQTHFINFIKATPIWLQHNIFYYSKINLITAKSFSVRQNQFHHGKFIFTTAESFLLRDSNGAMGAFPTWQWFDRTNKNVLSKLWVYASRRSKLLHRAWKRYVIIHLQVHTMHIFSSWPLLVSLWSPSGLTQTSQDRPWCKSGWCKLFVCSSSYVLFLFYKLT